MCMKISNTIHVFKGDTFFLHFSKLYSFIHIYILTVCSYIIHLIYRTFYS